MSHSNCPECGTPGKAIIRFNNGRHGFACIKCPKQLVRKGHEVGFTLSGPRWLGPIPPPRDTTGSLGITAGLAMLAYGGLPR